MPHSHLRAAVLMCHAPIVIPAVGGREADRCAGTTGAMREAAECLVRSGAERLVLLSPHAPRLPSAYGAFTPGTLRGSLARFGHPTLTAEFAGDEAATDAIHAACLREGIAFEAIPEKELDHGAFVPLWFLHQAGFRVPLTVVAFPWSRAEGSHARFGHALGRAMQTLGPWALLASGDMSHALRPGAPGGFHPRAHEFDRQVVGIVEEGLLSEICRIPEALKQLAAEDVTESLEVAAGLLGADPLPTRLLSYEAPFGVGYLEAILQDAPEGP